MELEYSLDLQIRISQCPSLQNCESFKKIYKEQELSQNLSAKIPSNTLKGATNQVLYRLPRVHLKSEIQLASGHPIVNSEPQDYQIHTKLWKTCGPSHHCCSDPEKHFLLIFGTQNALKSSPGLEIQQSQAHFLKFHTCPPKIISQTPSSQNVQWLNSTQLQVAIKTQSLQATMLRKPFGNCPETRQPICQLLQLQDSLNFKSPKYGPWWKFIEKTTAFPIQYYQIA